MNHIFEKYWDALTTTAIGAKALSHEAVRLALLLAIKEASADQPTQSAAWQREAESAIGQIGRLNEWLEQKEIGLYSNPNHDTADAILSAVGYRDQQLAIARAELASALADVTALGEELRKAEAMTAEQPGYEERQNRLMRWLIDNEPEASLACDADKGVAGVIIALLDKQRLSIANYDQALTHAQNEAAMLRQQRASLQEDLEAAQQAREDNRQEVQQLRQELTQALQRAAVVDPTPAPDWGPSHPAWQGLTAADLGVIDQLASGATKFRKLTRPARCDLVLRAIRHLASERNGTISGGDWDRYRPLWMPTTGAVMMLSDDGRWPSLLALALETPAASAA